MIVRDLDERVRLRHTPGRKRADLVLDEKYPQGRDAVWAAIRRLRRFTVGDVQAETRQPTATITSYLQGLQAAGYVSREAAYRHRRTERGGMRFIAPQYELVKDVGVVAPRVTRKGQPVTQGSARDRMWQAMRILKDFSADELVAAASCGGAPVSRVDAYDYIRHLARARYLVITQPRGPGRCGRYKLVPVRNTGPRAPMVQRIKQVFDANLGQVVWPAPAEPRA